MRAGGNFSWPADAGSRRASSFASEPVIRPRLQLLQPPAFQPVEGPAGVHAGLPDQLSHQAAPSWWPSQGARIAWVDPGSRWREALEQAPPSTPRRPRTFQCSTLPPGVGDLGMGFMVASAERRSVFPVGAVGVSSSRGSASTWSWRRLVVLCATAAS
jgi:hypothetical protein